jgi:hypothetical protein
LPLGGLHCAKKMIGQNVVIDGVGPLIDRLGELCF